ncbi:hypothetical protein HWV62_10363 [Athelia sp. TMB]|nr:hypothetical protein HWV62_10363 [Athelia sp. TMB]
MTSNGTKSFRPSNLNGKIRLTPDLLLKGNFRGGYGDVYIGFYDRDDGKTQKVAIKILRPPVDKPNTTGAVNDNRSRREIRVWKLLDHPNVAQLLGLTTDFDQLDRFFTTKSVFPGMVSLWMENGNLDAYLKKHSLQTAGLLKLVSISTFHANNFAYSPQLCDVVAGLEYLHSEDIIHGDLTPANILIDDNGKACLTDFGLSSLKAGFQGTSYWTGTIGGAMRWRAPELLPSIHWDATVPFAPVLTTACDIFSYGQIVLQVRVFSEQFPYYEIKSMDCLTIQLFLRKEPQRPSASISPKLTDKYWMLAKECWGKDLNPDTRPSAEALRLRLVGLYENALRLQ